jgi:hypothetical protein
MVRDFEEQATSMKDSLEKFWHQIRNCMKSAFNSWFHSHNWDLLELGYGIDLVVELNISLQILF